MIRRALEFVRGMRLTLLAANLLAAAGSLCAAAVPSVLGGLFDRPEEYLHTSLMLLGVMAAGSAAGWLRTRLLARMSARLSVKLRMALMEKLMHVRQSFYAAHSSGELLSLEGNDVNLFRDALSGGLTYILDTLLSLIMVLVLMVRLDAVLTLVLMAFIGVIFAANMLLTRGVTGISARAQEGLAEISSLSSQAILGNQTLRAYQLEGVGLSRLLRANTGWAHASVRLEDLRARSSLVIGLLGALQLIALIVLGAARVQAGTMTMGGLTAFILYAQSVSGPLTGAASLAVDVRRALAAIRRLFAVLDEPDETPGTMALPAPVRGEIDISGLSFSYGACGQDGEVSVLRDLNMKIPAGSTAALVGESGSGKTTLMQMIAGFLPVDEGCISIDGVSVSDIEPASLRGAVAVVSQNPFLFSLSVRDNIACGRPDADDREIEQAARLACAHEFIMRLPNGYQTMLGENGANLSGGQRQRIAIARAFLKNAPILLLDEATSALDNRVEAEIQTALETLMRGRTTLIIAHRLSTVRHADCICYLGEGRILASGPHGQMMERCPEYRALYEQAVPEAP